MNLLTPTNVSIAAVALTAFVTLMLMFKWRTVVQTNVVHIVQSRKKTTSFGAGREAGNVYYAIPPWVPAFGLTVTELPVNNFSQDLNDYQAYDKDRVPFNLHVTAFFRIANTDRAAERVAHFGALQEQLLLVMKGAVRKILASHDIHNIMVSRATFGQAFTEEVSAELESWGVVPVKSMELMDIKDANGSHVIADIMAKKTSHIEMESRVEVASNQQKAKTAEIDAARTVELSAIEAKRTTSLADQDMQQAVGERTAKQEQAVGVARAEQQKAVGVATEKAQQETKAQAAITKEKEMQIVSVQTQRQAEIQREAAIVVAEQQKKVTVTVAEGQLEKTKLEAAGTEMTGAAKAQAEKAMQLAPIQAQIELAKEIGNNANYQTYLVTLRQVEASQAVGIAQAEALKEADIKVFANTGDAPSGITSVGDLFGTKGGLAVGAALEALKATKEGAAVAEAVARVVPPAPSSRPAQNGNGAK